MSTANFNSSSRVVMGSLGGSLGSHLPQITVETELHKLLTDEKARSEKHKINYQQLKVEHTRLQDKVLELEAENKSTVEESRLVKDKYLSMYEACSRELAQKLAELEEMRTKVVTPQRFELIRVQIMEELDQLFKEKSKKQEAEVEEYRSALSKLRYELSFLKSEYEHDSIEHKQQMEDLIKQHDIELTNLRQDRDTVVAKVQAETSQDTQKVRILQRDNAKLHLQVRELLVEIEEIRAQKEKLGLDSENVSRMQSKLISEHQATIQTLQAERESLKRQLEYINRELTAAASEQNKLKNEMHELEKKNTILKGHAEEMSHRSKVSLSDLKMEMLKQRGEIEKQRDKLGNEVEDLRHAVDIAEMKIKQLQHSLEEKERESVQLVQAAREEEFSKMAKVENEKFELETKLQELERRRIDDDARRHAEEEKCNERVSQANTAKDQAERELLSIKTRLSHMDSLHDQLERERSENSTLKSRILKLETELGNFKSSENEITDSNMRLKNNSELLREELKMTQAQLEKLTNNHEVILLQQRSAMAEDRTQLEVRIHELEEKLDLAQSKYSRASVIHKKLKKKTSMMIDRLKDKLVLLEAQYTELEIEKKALQKCVPFDQYNHLRKQWKDLWRRHQEFRTILFSIPNNSGVHSVMKVSKLQLDSSALLNHSAMDKELEEQHQEDLKILRLRLEALDKVQNQQLAELTELTPREKHDVEKDLIRTPSIPEDQLSVHSDES